MTKEVEVVSGFKSNGALRIEHVALWRTTPGELRLSFPVRRDRSGREHPLVRPLDNDARQAIEAQVLTAAGLDRGATP